MGVMGLLTIFTITYLVVLFSTAWGESVKEMIERDKPSLFCEYPMPDNYKKKMIAHERDSGVRIVCDPRTDGGAWIILQRRRHGNVSFDHNLNAYRVGFGFFTGDFWLGLEPMYNIMKNHKWEIRFEFEDTYGRLFNATYRQVTLLRNFKISIRWLKSKTKGLYDAITQYGNRNYTAKFFAADSEPPDDDRVTCAKVHRAGWWYVEKPVWPRTCASLQFNSMLATGSTFWHKTTHLKATEIKIRRMEGPICAVKDCRQAGR